MQKNVAGQRIGVQMVSASDGTAFTGTVTVYVTGDAGSQAIGSVGSGVCTHEGNGYHSYTPAQSETDFDLIAFTFVGTGAVPVTVQVYTAINPVNAVPTAAANASAVWDKLTVDHTSTGSFGAKVGSLSTSSVTVAPLQATAPNRVAGTEIVAYINDTSAIGPIVVTDGDGDAVDLSSYTLKVCIELKSSGTINANITPTVSGTGNNQFTFTPTSDCVSSTLPRKWSLRSTNNGEVLAFGDFTVESTARLS